MAHFGYARVSTPDQIAGLENQVRILREHCTGPDDDFLEEKTSAFMGGHQVVRDELIQKYMRKGDCLIVTQLSKLCRRPREIIEIDEILQKKGAHLKILDPGMDTSTPIGRMMVTVIAAIDQMEVETMKERQAVGIAAAKAAGKYKGRKPISDEKREKILKEVRRGSKIQMIADHFKVSRPTIYNLMKAAGVTRPAPGETSDKAEGKDQ